MAWLLWRKRWLAAAHWLAALAFGLVLTALLGAVVDMPNPPTAPLGFSFPSIAVTMATITFGFFAVLIAREMPGRRRVWPYLVSGAVVAVLGFARLYLGAHWLSDVRSEEHTSELQSLMRTSYAVLCLNKNDKTNR